MQIWSAHPSHIGVCVPSRRDSPNIRCGSHVVPVNSFLRWQTEKRPNELSVRSNAHNLTGRFQGAYPDSDILGPGRRKSFSPFLRCIKVVHGRNIGTGSTLFRVVTRCRGLITSWHVELGGVINDTPGRAQRIRSQICAFLKTRTDGFIRHLYGYQLPMKAQKLRQSRKDDGDEDAQDKLGTFIASRPVLLSAATFLGAGALWLTETDKGSLLAALKPYTPAAMSLAGSFLAGLVIGRIARRKLKHVLIAGGAGVVAVSLLTKFGVIGPAADQWVQSTVGWVSEHMDKVQSYVAALLPSAAAAGSGLYLGFRHKRKPPGPN